MARRCSVTDTKHQTGHKVSHSNHKTNVRFMVNLQNVSLMSDALGRQVRLRISAATLRSIEHNGGLDAYLTKTSTRKLTDTARRLKKQIEKKQAAAA